MHARHQETIQNELCLKDLSALQSILDLGLTSFGPFLIFDYYFLDQAARHSEI